jgi:uncharacterized protein YegL
VTEERPRQPLTIVLDTSSSMHEFRDHLVTATRSALEWAWNSSLLPVRPQIGVIATGGTARVVVAHGEPLDPVDLDDLGGSGPADIGGTVQLLAGEVERCTTENLRAGHRTLRPWVLLVSDGRWSGPDTTTAIDALHAPPTEPVVHPVGVGELDETALARVATGDGVAVDTPADLDSVLAELVRSILLHPDRVPAPAGSRPLEGW